MFQQKFNFFWGSVFEKQLKLFRKSSLKSILIIFLHNLLMFCIFEFCFFLFFCSLQEDSSLYRMTSYLFYVSMNNEQ